MKNILSDDPSPYLQQHKNNPVHWQTWSKETLNYAKKNSKPILLSIGYNSGGSNQKLSLINPPITVTNNAKLTF